MSQKALISAYDFSGLLTEWRRDRNTKYREIKNMDHCDFISKIMADREAIEKDMDEVLPEYMHSSTVPNKNDYEIIYS